MGAVRFRGEMRDTTGDEWRVDIYDSQYSGSPDSITLAEDGWALTWNGDIRNKVNPILTSEAVISFVMRDATDESLMTLIAGNVEGRFTVAIYQVIATVPVLFWTGTVLTDQVAYLDEYYPIRAEIRATDDIGALQDVPYDNNGTPYASNGYKTVIGHVHEALLKTRQVANFYVSTDNFLTYANDFYSVDDDVSVTNHLNSTRIYNLTWNNPNDEGINQIVSAYEVLESICLTYNARLFQYAGSWYFLPIGVYQYDETAIACQRLKFDGTSGTSFTYSNPFQEVGSGLKKLRGWRIEYYQPYKNVKRTQVYNGNNAIVARNFYDAIAAPTISDADIDYPQDQLLKISGIASGAHTATTTVSGQNRIGRFVMKLTIKVGTYYLKRDITYTGTGSVVFFDEGTAATYTEATYGAVSWTTTPSTYDTISTVFDLNGYYGDPVHGASFTYDLILPELPAALNGLDFKCEMYAVNYAGTETLATEPPYDGGIDNLRVDWVEDGLTNGDTITWTATGQSSNRGTLDQGQILIGDLVSANSRGVLYVIGSSGEQESTGWRSLNVTTGNLAIHRLATQEVQALHNVTTKGYQGTLHSEILGPVHLLKDGGDYYMPTSISIQANERYTDFQGFRLTRDITSITSDDDGRRDVNDPVIGTGQNTGAEPLAAFTSQAGITSVNGDSGPAVDLDAADIAYGGGATVKDQLDDNTTDITAVKGVIAIGATTVDFWDGNTGTRVDTTANDVSLQVDKTDVLVVTGTTITNKQATTVESTLKTTGTLTAETGVGVTNILAKNSSTKAVIALQDGGSTDANQVAIASSGDGMVLQTGGAGAVSIDSTGQVGIGVVAPSAQLDVVGKVEITGTIDLTDASDNVIIGNGAGNVGTATNSQAVAVGVSAGAVVTTANKLTAIGYKAANSITTQGDNTAVGHESQLNATGSGNTTLGQSTARNATGGNNTVIGNYAGLSGDLGSENVAVGKESMRYGASSATYNVAIGTRALLNNTTGAYTTAIGGAALQDTSNANQSVGIGYRAGNNVSGTGNVFIGYRCMDTTATVSNRLAIENSTDVTTPLIYGEFDNDIVKINGSLEVTDAAEGIILRDTNGVRYNVTVNTSGVLVVTSI